MSSTRTRLKAYGRFDTGLVDAEPVREHMAMLAEFGMGYKRVAAIAGIGITPTRNIIWGRQDSGPRYGEMQKHVKRETAEALLAVKPEISLLAGGARIPARGTHRRVQALMVIGWSQSKLGARLGIAPGNFGTLMRASHVSVRRHLAVAALYEALWNTRPPREEWRDKIAYSRSLAYAKKRRWLPPLAWDDIDTDVEQPIAEVEEGAIDEMAVVLAIAGDHVRLTTRERREAVRQLTDAGYSLDGIAERLHITDRTVSRIRQEFGTANSVGVDGQVVA
jgi:hypothetical protein